MFNKKFIEILKKHIEEQKKRQEDVREYKPTTIDESVKKALMSGTWKKNNNVSQLSQRINYLKHLETSKEHH